MAVQKWGAPESAASTITTGFTSLANAARVASASAIANATDLYTHMAIEAYFTHASSIWASTPATGAHLAVYAVPAIDGSNTIDGVSVAPGAALQIGAIPVRNAASQTASRTGDFNMEIPPFNFYLVIQNNAGVAFNSSLTGQTIKTRRYGLTVA